MARKYKESEKTGYDGNFDLEYYVIPSVLALLSFPLTGTLSISTGSDTPISFLAETRKSYSPSDIFGVFNSVSTVLPTGSHFFAPEGRCSTR